eukprot:6996054-Pyramimonas_sp.AAC.1
MRVFWAVNGVAQHEPLQRNGSNGSAEARINMQLHGGEIAVCVPVASGVVLAVELPCAGEYGARRGRRRAA